MDLTRQQRKNLELYLSYRTNPPTLWRLLRRNLPRYLLSAALLVVLNLLAPAAGIQSLSLVLIGLFLGALARDISYFWRFARFWPVRSEVLDWQRIVRILSESDSG